MLIIKNDEFNDEIALIIKFGEEKHIDRLVKGFINVDKIDTYRKMELESGIAGVGDKYDGCSVIYDFEIKKIIRDNLYKIYDASEYDYLTYKPIKVKMTLRRERDVNTPVFCCMGIRKSELEMRDGKMFFNLSKPQIEKLKEDFNDYTHVFIASAGGFAKKILEQASKNNLEIDMKMVKYYKENENEIKRVGNIASRDVIFWKRDIFQNQREFRVAFINECIQERKDIINIGNLKDISLVLEKEIVLDEKFELEFIENDE